MDMLTRKFGVEKEAYEMEIARSSNEELSWNQEGEIWIEKM